jgi:hypothetical protein
LKKNNQLKKYTKGESQKNSTLKGASKKKKNYRGESQNSPTLQGSFNLFTQKYIIANVLYV